MSGKYRITYNRGRVYPWWLYIPNASIPIGSFSTRDRAAFVMDAHARGADCDLFLTGRCGCRWECGR